MEHPEVPESFHLDDTAGNVVRRRFTSSDVPRGATEHVQFRASAFNVRRVDEIVASRVDPSLGTRSDVFQDALAMWLEDWDHRFPDGADRFLRAQANMHRLNHRRQYRKDLIEGLEVHFRNLCDDGDIQGLKEFTIILEDAWKDVEDESPSRERDQYQSIRENLGRLLREA